MLGLFPHESHSDRHRFSWYHYVLEYCSNSQLWYHSGFVQCSSHHFGHIHRAIPIVCCENKCTAPFIQSAIHKETYNVITISLLKWFYDDNTHSSCSQWCCSQFLTSFRQIYLPCIVAYFIKPRPKVSVVTNKGVL